MTGSIKVINETSNVSQIDNDNMQNVPLGTDDSGTQIKLDESHNTNIEQINDDSESMASLD